MLCNNLERGMGWGAAREGQEGGDIGIHGYVCAQSFPTLWSPLDCSPPGSSVHEIFQARILEWVAISFYRGSSWQIPFGVWQKTTEQCKAIILQLKKFFLKHEKSGAGKG